MRKYLKLLPDFDDIEAEEKALEIVAGHPRLNVALDFLTLWPSLDRAAKLVLARADALDGNDYMTLSQAAEALDARHPLAATLLRRGMISDTLSGAKSSRYRHAARHLAECASADAAISDYGGHPAHGQFVETLRAQHGRKYGSWGLVDG
nr:DUF6880 family protein [Rhabdonatronobacter sediminivivens]